MNKLVKLTGRVALALALAMLIGVTAVILVIRSQRFQNYVRERLSSYINESTGGHTQVNSFRFDWRTLTATITGLTVRGTEPSGDPPLFYAPLIVIRFQLFSFGRAVDLDYLSIDQPFINVLVFPNHQTNVPRRQPASSLESDLNTAVALAIQRFDITNGSLHFVDHNVPLNLHGSNVLTAFSYNHAQSQYQGQVSASLTAQYRSLITSRVTIPLLIGREGISVTNARLDTARSSLVASVNLYDPASPRGLVDIAAHIDLADLQAVVAAPIHLARTSPRYCDLRSSLTMTNSGIVLQYASLDLGKSHISGAGAGSTSASFQGSISLGEVSDLFAVPQLPAGTLSLSGQADLAFANYSLHGIFASHNLQLKYADIGKTNLSGAFTAEPSLIELSQVQLDAMHARLTARFAVHDLHAISGTANLQGLTLSELGEIVRGRNLGYSGLISGKAEVSGLVEAPSVSADLSVAPTHGQIPVAGHLLGDYDGAARLITITDSSFTFPHSRIQVTGKPGYLARLTLRSRNLGDFSPLLAMASLHHPVSLAGGLASVDLAERGALQDPSLSGSVELTKFTVDGRLFDALSAAFNASRREISVSRGVFDRGTSHARFSVVLGLDNWKPRPSEPLSAELTMQNGQLTDLLTLAGEASVPAEGQIATAVHLNGTLGNPNGAVQVNVTHGRVFNDVFDDALISADLSDRQVAINKLEISAPAGRIDLEGSFTHPATDILTGSVRAQLHTSVIDLSRVATLQSYRPGFAGSLQVGLSVEGMLSTSRPAWSTSFVDGYVNAAGLRDRAESFGDVKLAVNTHAGSAAVRLSSTLAGSAAEINGAVALLPDFPFAADLKVSHLAVGRMTSLLALGNLPVAGSFDCTAHVTGTPFDPIATADFQLTKGRVGDEAIDRLSGDLDYKRTQIQVSSVHAITPAGQLTLSASFSHPANDFRAGRMETHVTTAGLNLSRVEYVHKWNSGLNGMLNLNASAAAELRRIGTSEQILPLSMDADAQFRQLSLTGQSLGDLIVQARTARRAISFSISSDLAKASIHGSGAIDLQNHYPARAEVNFSNVTYAGLTPLVGRVSDGSLDARVDGSARFEGSLTDLRAATGQLQLTRLEITPVKEVSFKNQGTLTLTLNRGTLSVANARIIGPSTDIAVSGAVPLASRAPMDLAIRANADLAVLKTFFPGAVSSGLIDVTASLRGTLAAPNFSGRIRLTGGSFQLVSWPNGFYRANTVILLSGSGGQIQSFTGESGGGKVAVTGFFSLTGSTLAYDLHADARNVRTRYSGASVTANALLTLSGTDRHGLLTGTVTISRVGYGDQSDIGSILSAATKPPAPPSAEIGSLSAIRANVRIQTASNILFQTTLAQQLAATADLTLLGSLQSPGMVGRINITSGSLIFFANKYSVNRGVISFYDPNTIQPVLDIDLETIAQGVDVSITASGPIDNLKLTYRSDPPLKFEDIVALLAAGKTPPDPTIASNQPVAPDQSAMQMGESALVGAAIANPVASRLQRVFGVTQFTIAPTFVSGTALPQARVVLQQQVMQNVTLTYSQDLSQSNAELVRIDWEFTPRFSAVATRDENGIFSVDFFWKKQFH